MGTAKGPTCFGPLVRVMSAASTMARVDGPPEPMMMPVRSLETSSGARPAVDDRLIHRDVIPGGAAAVKAHRATVDDLFRFESRRALHLAAEAELGVFFGARDAGARLAQARQHLLSIVADRGDDAHAGDDDASHTSLQMSLRLATLEVRRKRERPA